MEWLLYMAENTPTSKPDGVKNLLNLAGVFRIKQKKYYLCRYGNKGSL
ncbi:hypothetical protein [Riemerella anatipestifer]|nr:hypothetical protein [Riemerella anatipestifer]